MFDRSMLRLKNKGLRAVTNDNKKGIMDVDGRYFCKVVDLPLEDSWGFNMFYFGDGKVFQRAIGSGSQEAPVTSSAYSPGRHTLAFTTYTTDDAVEISDIYEISADLAEKLLEDKNWASLSHGFKIKSEKTLDWLEKRGVQVGRITSRTPPPAPPRPAPKVDPGPPVGATASRRPSVVCAISHVTLTNAEGSKVPSIQAACAKCGHVEASFGRRENSLKRCLVMLSENCPRGERNFYAEGHTDEEAPKRPTRLERADVGTGEVTQADFSDILAVEPSSPPEREVYVDPGEFDDLPMSPPPFRRFRQV